MPFPLSALRMGAAAPAAARRAVPAGVWPRLGAIGLGFGLALGSLAARIARRWRDRARSLRLQDLDDATLRDLGLTRSELSSLEMEASGRIEATRQRVRRPEGPCAGPAPRR